MNFNHTDLAMERILGDTDRPGVEVHQWEENGVKVTEVIVETQDAAHRLSKPCGNYLTLECPLLLEQDVQARIAVSNMLGEELARLLAPGSDEPVMVVGLGNRMVTPDALGPMSVDKVLVTRHMTGGEFSASGLYSVCAIAPGVLGVTGIETAEMVESLAKSIRPRAIICIDSLAARDFSRIGCALQITNTGIQPGSGVGNHRRALTRESTGAQVIAVGIPTVIYAATLARDAFSMLADKRREECPEDVLESMERELLGTNLGSLIVTPRDIDAIVRNCAGMIAGGINRALQSELSDSEIAAMMD